MTNFYVTAHWDEEAQVYYSESNIDGLFIEAPTIEEFEEVMMDAAPELIVANHIKVEDLREKSITDLITPYVWRPPPKAIDKQAALAG